MPEGVDNRDAVAGGAAPSVRLRGISKAYPGVRANNQIDLDLTPGSVHGLLGENGAGKSTLVKILFGLVHPDAGTIEVDGVERTWHSPSDALAAGIGMVQQHFSLVADFTITENLVLGDEPRRYGLIDRRKATADVQQMSDRYGFRLDASRKVRDLAVGARQRVEIMKALYRGAQVLVLDEPTAALAPQEVSELFGVLDGLRAQGCTIVLISHKLDEIIAMCDDVTVLRDGAVVQTRRIDASEREHGPARAELELHLATWMVGRPLPAPPERGATVGNPVLRVEAGGDGAAVGPVSFEVRAGEVVGIAGVEGNGQTELIELIVGTRRCRAGSIHLHGVDVTRASVRTRLHAGLAHIAEDRHAAGVALEASLVDNCVLGSDDRAPFTRSRWKMARGEMDRFAADIVKRYDVRVPSLRATVGQLSGGNQQKLVVGREVARSPRLMIAAQPTRGLDVGATAFVHQELSDLRDAGCAVLLVSLDLTEIMAIADRILVMHGGRIVGEGRPGEIDDMQLGRWMTGAAA
jgi:general nucleoside transport system ATP-binding protein